MHQIQKRILSVLIYRPTARFSELRPPKTDSNLFCYHLKALMREGLLERSADGGYRLTPQGLFLVDRLSIEKLEPRLQPKLITMTLLQDPRGRIGLQERKKQPFIGQWTLPSGKVHLGESLVGAAQRELREKAGLADIDLRHAGDSYVHAYLGDVLVSSVLAHVFFGRIERPEHEADVRFVTAADMDDLKLLPGIKEVITSVLEQPDGRFFSEVVDRRPAAD